jgi:hypothetical protein
MVACCALTLGSAAEFWRRYQQGKQMVSATCSAAMPSPGATDSGA